MEGDEGGEVQAFFKCQACRVFLLSREKANAHREACPKQMSEVDVYRYSDGGDGDDLEMGNSDFSKEGTALVAFPVPKLILERVTRKPDVKIKCEILEEEEDGVKIPQVKTEAGASRKRKRRDPVFKEILGEEDSLGAGLMLTGYTRRKSSMQAMKKLKQVIEMKEEDSGEGEWESFNFEEEKVVKREDHESGGEWEGSSLNEKIFRQEDHDSRSEWEENGMGKEVVVKQKVKRRTKHQRRRQRRDGDKSQPRVYYKYKCDLCPSKFVVEEHLSRHMSNIHSGKNEEIFTCPVCGRLINRRLTFQSHVKRHQNAEDTEIGFDLWNKWPPAVISNKTPVFNCKYCLTPHKSHSSFIMHMNTEHADKGQYYKFQCQYSCGKEWGSIKLLLKHIREDHTEEYFGKVIWNRTFNPARPRAKCDICGKEMDAYHIPNHKKRFHSAPAEGRTVSDRNSRKRAYATDLPYSCPLFDCDRSFKNAALLKGHFILHLENNPFVCKFPGCTVKCDAQCHLDRHMKLHFAQRLPCTKCGLTYSRIDHLRNHTCRFDQKRIGEDGLLKSRYSHKRLMRVGDLEEGVTMEELGMNVTDINNANSDAINLKEICSKDDNQVVIKLERNGEIYGEIDSSYEGSNDAGKEGSNGLKRKKQRTKIRINDIIISDPVFIEACRENPGFGEIILGGGYKTKRKNKPRNWTCQKCHTIFTSASGLFLHRKQCKGERNNLDPEVKTEVVVKPDPDGNTKMKEESTGGSKVGCPICNDSFLNNESLQNHLENDHKTEEIFKCDKCGQTFFSQTSLSRHINRQHTHRPFKCTKCDKRYSTRTGLKQHYLDHQLGKAEPERPTCETCGKDLCNTVSLRRHMFLIHGITALPEKKEKTKKPRKTKKKTVQKKKGSRNRPKRKQSRKLIIEDDTDEDDEDFDYEEAQVKNELDPKYNTLHIVKIEAEPELQIDAGIDVVRSSSPTHIKEEVIENIEKVNEFDDASTILGM